MFLIREYSTRHSADCRYKIVPLGSFSRIEELPPSRNSYDLYYSTEFTQVLQTRKFNHGLVALLDCLRQLVEHGRKSERDWGKGNIEYVSSNSLLCRLMFAGYGKTRYLPTLSDYLGSLPHNPFYPEQCR